MTRKDTNGNGGDNFDVYSSRDREREREQERREAETRDRERAQLDRLKEERDKNKASSAKYVEESNLRISFVMKNVQIHLLKDYLHHLLDMQPLFFAMLD